LWEQIVGPESVPAGGQIAGAEREQREVEQNLAGTEVWCSWVGTSWSRGADRGWSRGRRLGRERMQTRGGAEAAAGSRPSDAAPAAADQRRSTGPWRRRGGSTRIAPGRSPATRDPGAGGQGDGRRDRTAACREIGGQRGDDCGTV
jgi:hypothetical protein